MEDEDMLTQPPESPRRDDDGQLYTQPPEETGEPPQRARFAFALVPERDVADVFCPQMADLVAIGRDHRGPHGGQRHRPGDARRAQHGVEASYLEETLYLSDGP